MKDILLHKSTMEALEAFCSNPSHAVLVLGTPGSGKYTVGRFMATQLLHISDEDLQNYPYFSQIGNNNERSISIDSIRQLQEASRLKTPGSATVRRILVVYGAERMTTEAQNAFLKLLEEPPADTVIILTATNTDSLLTTIVSRVTRILVKHPTQKQVEDYFSAKGYSDIPVRRAFYLAEGAVGLMHALLENETEHPLVASVEKAKKLLAMNRKERLNQIEALVKDKEALPLFLFALERVCHAKLIKSIQESDIKQTRQATSMLDRILNAESVLRFNPNQKLLMTDLFLGL